MSATSEHATVVSRGDGPVDVKMEKKESSKNYKGFVAGVFSGVAKLSGEYRICLLSSHLLPDPEFLNCNSKLSQSLCPFLRTY
jgi:hypothetical protein